MKQQAKDHAHWHVSQLGSLTWDMLGLARLTTFQYSPTSSMSTLPTFRYLSAWFCPFAHRATLALEHHRDRVQYEWIEALGWFQQDDANNITGTGTEWYYHWKADEVRQKRCRIAICFFDRF
jgi:alpha/beta superfamily hydrolase